MTPENLGFGTWSVKEGEQFKARRIGVESQKETIIVGPALVRVSDYKYGGKHLMGLKVLLPDGTELQMETKGNNFKRKVKKIEK